MAWRMKKTEVMPGVELLQEKLEQGCTFKTQYGCLWLLDREGRRVVCGTSLRSIIKNIEIENEIEKWAKLEEEKCKHS